MPKRTDAEIAKNYLSQEEVTTLNRIVSLYLDFAELQAEEHHHRRPPAPQVRRPGEQEEEIALLAVFARGERGNWRYGEPS